MDSGDPIELNPEKATGKNAQDEAGEKQSSKAKKPIIPVWNAGLGLRGFPRREVIFLQPEKKRIGPTESEVIYSLKHHKETDNSIQNCKQAGSSTSSSFPCIQSSEEVAEKCPESSAPEVHIIGEYGDNANEGNSKIVGENSDANANVKPLEDDYEFVGAEFDYTWVNYDRLIMILENLGKTFLKVMICYIGYKFAEICFNYWTGPF